MASIFRLLSRLVAGMLVALLSNAALADPPGRVGRLADLQGQVWHYDTETAEWVGATRNRPLTSGDRISTDANARAELRIGSTTLRLDAGTEVELLQLDDDIVRVQLHNGLLALRLRTHEAAREFELLTSEGHFRPDRAGRYRLDRIDATSSVTVWSGQLLFEAPDNAVTLVSGQRADIYSNSGRTQYALTQPQRDAFADEVAASELADERSVSARYVSPEMTGVEELDRHGRWENDADYGALWVPRVVAPGWAPYRFGHWAWVRPWGWTWIDDAAWGFAPFHYGRWVFLRNAWCWSPGTWVARPVYAPALVAWVGVPLGAGSVSIGLGPSVGWFPLGPREVFVPGYRSSPHYVRNINATHVPNIGNVANIVNSPNTVVQQTIYVNRSVPGAMTVVPASVVSGRQPVAPARVQLTDPRPSTGGERGAPLAALATVMATPALAPPVSRPNAGAAPPRPVAAPPISPGMPGAMGRGAAPPPTLTQPADRVTRPGFVPGAAPPSVSARPLPIPTVAQPPMPTLTHPAPAAPTLLKAPLSVTPSPAALAQPTAPTATVASPAPPVAAPPVRPQPALPVVTAPRQSQPVTAPPKAAQPAPAPPAAPAPAAHPPPESAAVPVAAKPAPVPPRAHEPKDERREAGKPER